MPMSERLSQHAALIYIMVLISAADSRMSDRELRTIGNLVRTLPVFRGFDAETLVATAQACATLLADEDGLDTLLERVREALTDKLKETAYALAVEVAAGDGRAGQVELRLLELIRNRLPVDAPAVAAIERSARARYRSLG
jgi:tellurite resistance protein